MLRIIGAISHAFSTDHAMNSPSSHSQPYSRVFAMSWQWTVISTVVLSGTMYLIYRFAKTLFKKPPSSAATPSLSPVTSTSAPSTAASSQKQTPPSPSNPETRLQRGGAPILKEGVVPLTPDVADEIPLLQALDWQRPSAIRYNLIGTLKGGVSVSIGMHASLLIPGGNALYHREVSTLPGCPLIRIYQEPTERIEIYFSDPTYAFRSHALLHQTIGLKCTWKEVDMPPEESGFDYYRGAIVFDDPISFLFFTRHLCSQTYKNIDEYCDARHQDLPECSLIKKIKDANLNYSIDNSDIAEWTEKAKSILVPPQTLFVPPRMYAPGISRIIGAATSLLIPGWTSLREASLHQGIVYVELDEQGGLSLYFPTITESGKVIKNGAWHAQETHKGLQKIGIFFTHHDLSKNPLKNEFGVYGGALQCKDPGIITLYLMRVCSLRREEILEFIKIKKLETTQFGKNLEITCKRKLSGEDNYTIKILMCNDQGIPLEKISINLSKLSCQSIPDLPHEVRNLDVKEQLVQTFNKVKGSIAPYADGKSVEDLQRGIGQIIMVLNGDPYSGVPKGEEGKKFVQKMVFVLKHIFYLLPHAQDQENKVDIKALSLAQMAIGGLACAGGHVQAILSVYQSLKQFSPLQAHHTAQSHLNLAHVDRVVTEIIDKELQQLRSTIFQTLVSNYTNQYGGDPAHFKNKVLKAIGKIRGIPGAEMADYLDPYEKCAPTLDQEQMLKDFDRNYSLEEILNYLNDKIRYESASVSMDPIIDFLIRHAPKDIDSEDFLTDTINGKHLKKPFLIQILIIAGHFSYKEKPLFNYTAPTPKV